MYLPPLMESVCPVMKPASSATRKTTPRARELSVMNVTGKSGASAAKLRTRALRYYLPGALDGMLVRMPSNIFVPSSSRRDTDCCANAVFSFKASAGSVH